MPGLFSYMIYYTYILESVSSGMLYIGQTSNVVKRLQRHNEGRSRFIRGEGPCILLYSISFDMRSEAVLFERKLKGFKNPKKVRDWINQQSTNS